MTPAEIIEKIVEDTAERIMRSIEDERCIHKSSLVREIKVGIEIARQTPSTPTEIAAIMERIRRDIDPHGIIFGGAQ